MISTVHNHISCAIYLVRRLPFRKGRKITLKQGFTTMSFIIDGNVLTEGEDTTYSAKTGNVMIHRSNAPFRVLPKRKGERIIVNLDLRMHSEIDFFYYYGIPRVVHLSNPARFQRKLERLLYVWRQEHTVYREIYSLSLVFELVGQLLQARQNNEHSIPQLPPDDRIAPLIQYIEGRLHESLTVQQLSDFSHMHPSTLQRKLKQICGMTSSELIKHLRIKKGRELLEDSSKTLEQIAEACGFHDAAYFSRMFKQSLLMTPGQYRKRMRLSKRIESI